MSTHQCEGCQQVHMGVFGQNVALEGGVQHGQGVLHPDMVKHAGPCLKHRVAKGAR